MDAEARRETAAARQPIAGAQATALDLGGQRARDLQKRRPCAFAVDVDGEIPAPAHVSDSDWSNNNPQSGP